MRRQTVRISFSGLALAATLTLAAWAAPASAQIADVPGPGQPAPRPGPQCPRTLGCTYEERALPPAGYRFQALTVCGANCTTQYWISAMADGKPLLDLPPVRGGGMIAVARGEEGAGPPAIRVVMPGYGPNDPACCPSSYVETTYTWDAAQATLVAGEPVSTPTSEGDGWAGAHQRLMQDGFYEVMGGP
jgi:hypothetical protein